MVVTLIGYRGSGKTTVAALLAQQLGCDWVDADTEIERRAGRPIADIFAADGEETFRRYERDTIADLLSGESLVLAAGGGAILEGDTRKRITQAGPVVWLQASVAVLAERISRDRTTTQRRPQLTGKNVTDEIADVLAARESLYRECATLELATDDKSPGDIADEIFTELRKTKFTGP